jgi:hypothetical protein
MIPANSTRASSRAAVRQSSSAEVAARIAGDLIRQQASLYAHDGRLVTRGVVEFDGTPGAWSATLSQLDRPGGVATMYFAEGMRDVELRLVDGRRARARLTGTSFIAASQRVCHLAGMERLR